MCSSRNWSPAQNIKKKTCSHELLCRVLGTVWTQSEAVSVKDCPQYSIELTFNVGICSPLLLISSVCQDSDEVASTGLALAAGGKELEKFARSLLAMGPHHRLGIYHTLSIAADFDHHADELCRTLFMLCPLLPLSLCFSHVSVFSCVCVRLFFLSVFFLSVSFIHIHKLRLHCDYYCSNVVCLFSFLFCFVCWCWERWGG